MRPSPVPPASPRATARAGAAGWWRAWRAAALASGIAVLAACASVPDARERARPRPGCRPMQPGRATGAATLSRRIRAMRGTIFWRATWRWKRRSAARRWLAGNRVRLLTDGPGTYQDMLRSIAQARRYVHMETYIFDDDEEGARFAEALIAAKRRGADVALMVDAVGTLNTPDALFQRLRDAGVQVAVFNPVNPASGSRAGWSPNQRNHRKILVVDGKVGYLGGINVSAVYASSPAAESVAPGGADGERTGAAGAPWRDTHLRIDGPAVAQLEAVIERGWQSQAKEPLRGGGVAIAPAAGPTRVRILANQPDRSDGYTVYLTLMSAFESAQRSIHITMAYFVPDPAFVDALAAAARRGVDVVLVLPGFSDSSLVFHAGRSHYTRLLQAGVKLYERRDALLHAKTAVVDGVWSTVGSSNMDWRSFALNYEVNAVVLGADFGAGMEALFQRDVAASVRISPGAWQARGVDDRFMEFFSRMFERWL